MENTVRITSTTIGRKTIIGITGMIIMGFSIVHMLGNLQIYLGKEVFNDYAEMVKSNPLVLWGARMVLLVSAVTHVVLTMQHVMRNMGATPRKTAKTSRGFFSSVAGRSMKWSGIFLLTFLLFHLAHLTLGADVVEGYKFDPYNPYENFIRGFRNPFITSFYVAANIFLGLHLFHGARSLIQTLGLFHPQYDGLLKKVAIGFALMVSLGNISMPLAVLSGAIGCDVPNGPCANCHTDPK